jgi:DNA-binding NarL/FixJ family response regulator
MATGERYLPVSFINVAAFGSGAKEIGANLTERERQVLFGLSNGLSNKEIAQNHQLAEVTVKLHVKTLCRKLNARNRTHAAMIAKELGLV